MMNPNLMNPEIVTRMAQEREMEMRRQVRGLRQVEVEIGLEKPAAPKPRLEKRHYATVFAWLYAIVTR